MYVILYKTIKHVELCHISQTEYVLCTSTEPIKMLS